MQRQHLAFAIIALLLIAFVAASEVRDSPMAAMMDTYSAPSTKSFMLRAMDGDAGSAADALSYSEESLGETAADVAQRIIKTGNVELEVDSAADAVRGIAEIAEKYEGFVESSAVNEASNGSKSGSITIRIPVDAFSAAVDDAKALADTVTSESTHAQDVTEQYTDLEARLHAAQAQEAQYLVVLAQAETVGEILAVQEHLAQVRAQIESLQGQINYLENRTAYSTISFTVLEESRITIPAEKFELGEVIRDAARALVIAGQKILTGIIWIVILGGPFALLTYGAYRVYKAWQRRR